MLNVKQKAVKCQYLSFWFDQTGNWTQVRRFSSRLSISSSTDCDKIELQTKDQHEITKNKVAYTISSPDSIASDVERSDIIIFLDSGSSSCSGTSDSSCSGTRLTGVNGLLSDLAGSWSTRENNDWTTKRDVDWQL